MQNTVNFKLRKPEATDFYNVDDFNYNADIIDAELKKQSGNTYVHPDTPGNKHIPQGGTVGQTLINNGDGSATWGDVQAGGNGSVIVSASAPPGDASTIWIDTATGGIAKYWDGKAWVPSKAVWG